MKRKTKQGGSDFMFDLRDGSYPSILEQGSGIFNVEVSKYDSYKTMHFTKGKKIKQNKSLISLVTRNIKTAVYIIQYSNLVSSLCTKEYGLLI